MFVRLALVLRILCNAVDWRIGMNLLDKMKAEEFQKLVVRLGVDYLAKHVGVTKDHLRKVMRERSIKDSFEFLKGMSDAALLDELRLCGSYESVARRFKVSSSFVKSLYQHMGDRDQTMDVDKVRDEWDRLGYLGLVAVLHDVKISEVQRFAKRHGLKKPESYENESSIAHTTGRNGEVDYLRIRGLGKECDLTYTNPTAPFDVQDPEYGRVNVKTSNEFRYSSKTLPWKTFWKFDLNGRHACDHIAMVCRAGDGTVARVYVVPIVRLSDKPTFYLSGHTMAELRDCLIYLNENHCGALMRVLTTGKWVREVASESCGLGTESSYTFDSGKVLEYKEVVRRDGKKHRKHRGPDVRL